MIAVLSGLLLSFLALIVVAFRVTLSFTPVRVNLTGVFVYYLSNFSKLIQNTLDIALQMRYNFAVRGLQR